MPPIRNYKFFSRKSARSPSKWRKKSLIIQLKSECKTQPRVTAQPLCGGAIQVNWESVGAYTSSWRNQAPAIPNFNSGNYYFSNSSKVNSCNSKSSNTFYSNFNSSNFNSIKANYNNSNSGNVRSSYSNSFSVKPYLLWFQPCRFCQRQFLQCWF